MIDGFRDRLAARRPLRGAFVSVPSPAVVEMCGHAGFDFVILDREHGPAGDETLENQVRAADVANVASLVRVPSRAPEHILHALDAGANGVLVPHLITADDAAAAVAAAHFPPRGIRGISTSTRAGRYGLVTPAALVERSRREVVVVGQIEDGAALPNVGEIARVAGLDAMFVGPADLSTSLGYPGQPDHPEVAAAIDAIRTTVESVRGPALANFARNEAEVARLAANGYAIVCLSSSAIMARRLADLATSIKG